MTLKVSPTVRCSLLSINSKRNGISNESYQGNKYLAAISA